MARYFLIDVDKMKNVANPKEVIDSLNALGVLLSPEETEAKWKEVYNAGVKSNVITKENYSEPIYVGEPYHGKIITTDHWEELKKTL